MITFFFLKNKTKQIFSEWNFKIQDGSIVLSFLFPSLCPYWRREPFVKNVYIYKCVCVKSVFCWNMLDFYKYLLLLFVSGKMLKSDNSTPSTLQRSIDEHRIKSINEKHWERILSIKRLFSFLLNRFCLNGSFTISP